MDILVISRSRMVRRYYQSYAEYFDGQVRFLTAASVCKNHEQLDAVLLDGASLSMRAMEEAAEYYRRHPVFLVGAQGEGLTNMRMAGSFSSDLSLHEIVKAMGVHLCRRVENNSETVVLPLVECAILECLVSGATDKEIARDFDLCLSTVKYHLRRLYKRLNVRNRTQAALTASKIIV